MDCELEKFHQLKEDLSRQMLHEYLISLAESGETQEPVVSSQVSNF